MEEISLKIITVGGEAVGKTSLLETYTTDRFPTKPSSTIFESYFANSVVDRKIAKTSLWDTSGLEEYDGMRPICYLQTDVFLFVFNVASRDSLDELKTKWLPEVRAVCPNAPLVLVGTKSDLRDDAEMCARMRESGRSFVSTSEAEIFAERIGAACYVECSAMFHRNVRSAFEKAIRAAMTAKSPSKKSKKSKKDSGCSIM